MIVIEEFWVNDETFVILWVDELDGNIKMNFYSDEPRWNLRKTMLNAMWLGDI